MKANNFNWDTVFNTAEDLMIYTFNSRVQVVTNIKTGIAKVLRDGTVINQKPNMKISEYENFLLEVAQDAQKLEAIQP